MKRILLAFIMAICLVACSLDMQNPSGAEARMIVIGMDYENSDGAPSLLGTINDAYEVGAAFSTVFASKGIPMDVRFLVQEGIDIILEVNITSQSSLVDVSNEVLARIARLEPSEMEMTEISPTEALIKARIRDLADAELMRTELERKYDGRRALVDVNYINLRDTSNYPSRENIISTLEGVDLGKDDLLIVYYTGHGERYSVISEERFKSILDKHIASGGIGRETAKSLVESLSILSEDQISLRLGETDVGSDAMYSIMEDVRKAMEEGKSATGALVTAPTEKDPFFGLLEMGDIYNILEKLECNAVLIVDACYSGFASSDSYPGQELGKAMGNFLQSNKIPHVAAMSASTADQTSKVTIAYTEEGGMERHSAFTIGILDAIGWRHSDTRETYQKITSYAFDDDGKAIPISDVRAVKGYLANVPQRMSARDLYGSVMERWQGMEQDPVRNSTLLNIYIIP